MLNALNKTCWDFLFWEVFYTTELRINLFNSEFLFKETLLIFFIFAPIFLAALYYVLKCR